MIDFRAGVSNRATETPSVIGFFRRQDSQASSVGSGSRRNSELEMQHQASVSEADMENRRQKRSLRNQFGRRNTHNSSMEETIPEMEPTSSSTTPTNNTRL